jgi:uncharacterized protein (TIGR02145 family)
VDRPGDTRDTDGTFWTAGYYGYWWSATESGASNAWYRLMHWDFGHVDRGADNKATSFSVRCLRDVRP